MAKTPKRMRIADLSVCFKIGLKHQVKKSEISILSKILFQLYAKNDFNASVNAGASHDAK